MTLAFLGLLFAAFVAYIAIAPRHAAEFHLFLMWGFLALSAVVALGRFLLG